MRRFGWTAAVAATWGLAGPLPAALAVDARGENRVVAGVRVRVVKVDLKDPATVLTIALANNAPRCNNFMETYGDEPFPGLVKRMRAAVVINGTFFSTDRQKRIMGTMVREGSPVNAVHWEPTGTMFGLRAGNTPEMGPAKTLDWRRHWLTMVAGPRLVKNGLPWLQPSEEGFRDAHVLGSAGRTAIGYTKDGRTLLLVTFHQNVTLAREAEAMQGLGAYQAMNLDGGSSRALAEAGNVLVASTRNLTNVLAVYDRRFPAPTPMMAGFRSFSGFAKVPPDPTLLPPDPPFEPDLPVAAAPTPTPVPAPEALRVLRRRPGRHVTFGPQSFLITAGQPALAGIRAGLLVLAPGNAGTLYAPWVGRPDGVLSFEARTTGKRLVLELDRSAGSTPAGTTIEYRRAFPAGCFLRAGGKLMAAARDMHAMPLPKTVLKWAYPTSRDLRVDGGWHRFRVEVLAGKVNVAIDGVPVLTSRRGPVSEGWALGGEGEIRYITVMQ